MLTRLQVPRQDRFPQPIAKLLDKRLAASRIEIDHAG